MSGLRFRGFRVLGHLPGLLPEALLGFGLGLGPLFGFGFGFRVGALGFQV